MSRARPLLVVASERAARAAAFDADNDAFEIVPLEAWIASLADALDPRVSEATWMEELALAAEVLAERGGNPSAPLAGEVTTRLHQLEQAGLDPAQVQQRLGKDRALAATPHIEAACRLAQRLGQSQRRSRTASVRTVLACLRSEPLFAQPLPLPEHVVVRDVLRVTPSLLALFAELSRVMERHGKRFEVELRLVERALGAPDRDALGHLGDLYAEALDGPPNFIMVSEQSLASCTYYPETDSDAAWIRAMAQLTGALDAGVAPDACGLAWRTTPPDSALRALAQVVRGSRVPVLAERRAIGSRGVDELLRWCELLAGDLRFDELLALLRSPILELDVADADAEVRAAVKRLIAAPLPRGPAASVLASAALAERGQAGASVFQLLADLATQATETTRAFESTRMIRQMLAALGLARGASRGGAAVFRAETWSDPAERALLASIAFEERAFATFETVREGWSGALQAMGITELSRGVADVARDLRVMVESQAPRMAGSAASVRSGSFGALGAERVERVVVLDASFEAWSPRSQEVAAALVQAERLRTLGLEAEWLQLRMSARQIDLITSSSDARGEPQRLHPMFGEPVRHVGDARLLLAQSEYAARRADADAALATRVDRQRAREGWRGDTETPADVVVGALPNGLPWLATEAKPLSPHAAEQFVVCPYRGFAGQELRARSESDADSVADPLEEGRILHTLLEKAFLAVREELACPHPDAARVRERGEAAAQEAGEPLLVGIRKVQVQRLLTWVTRALDEAVRDRSWRFDAAEIAFGPGHAWPPVEVDGTFFAGRIDRIDRSRGGEGKTLRVVDYKRSTVGSSKKLLQLPLYAIAAERNDPLGAQAEEGVYLVPRRASGAAGLRRVKLAPSATEVVRESLVPTLQRLRGGDIAPRPDSPSDCKSCFARGICRRPPFRVQEGP